MQSSVNRCLPFLISGFMVAVSLHTPEARADTIQFPIPGTLRTQYQGPITVLIPRFPSGLGALQSVTITFTPEISAIISGSGSGSPNSPNGWAAGLNGTVRLSGSGFGTLDYPFAYPDRSGLIHQPGGPVFEVYGPTALSGSVTFTSGFASYLGAGNTTASLSWPFFNPVLFFSQGGDVSQPTRDLGAVGGIVTYQYQGVASAAPEPGCLSLMMLPVAGLWLLASRRKRSA